MKIQRFIVGIFLGITIIFFFRFIFLGLLPIPSDTIIGLYHPYRDLYAGTNPQGIAYKNFLITDPVRQQYPWRELAISQFKQGQLPVWNPYAFSGTPLLANFQTAAFYPLNIIFFFVPFAYGWSLLVFLQPFLAGVFMYYYLRHFKLKTEAAMLGGICFAFSGFSVAWLEWNTIMHTALWLPMILLAKENLLEQRTWKWIGILIFSEISMFFAGHLQTFFYAFVFSGIYLIIRLFMLRKDNKKKYLWQTGSTFVFTGSMFLLLTVMQWFPTLQFILLSARNVDQANWQKEGWFLPWQHLIQFVSPDFFGNPATLNYWSIWNYGEFIAYIGLIPLIFVLYGIFFRRDKKVYYSIGVLALALLFTLPTIIAKTPFILQIPFLSSAQPTRIIFLIDFILAFLAACGLDYYLKEQRKIYIPIGILTVLLSGLWLFVLGIIPGTVLANNLIIAKRNLYFPTVLLLSSFILFIPQYMKKKRLVLQLVIIGVIGISLFDLFRFFDKFTPFTPKEYLYPSTKTISFLQKQTKPFRIMSLDSRILPPNFSSIYRIETIEGYDPLYLQRYGEYIVSSERDQHDISGPFGFNRIITPRNYTSVQKELLQIKYILSLDDIHDTGLEKVFEEGQTKVYENKGNIMPRAFFVKKILSTNTRQKDIDTLVNANRKEEAVLENADQQLLSKQFSIGKIISYSDTPNTTTLVTETKDTGFLVLSETYYPTWRVKIDEKEDKIYRTDYNFRGVVVPAGKHTITFFVSLF